MGPLQHGICPHIQHKIQKEVTSVKCSKTRNPIVLFLWQISRRIVGSPWKTQVVVTPRKVEMVTICRMQFLLRCFPVKTFWKLVRKCWGLFWTDGCSCTQMAILHKTRKKPKNIHQINSADVCNLSSFAGRNPYLPFSTNGSSSSIRFLRVFNKWFAEPLLAHWGIIILNATSLLQSDGHQPNLQKM